MIFLGYNFLKDRYCWQPTPTNLNDITNVRLENGIYDHFNITKDVNFPYVTDYPAAWDFDTKLDANFDGNINAGNVEFLLSQINNIRVKRRKKGSFDWVTLYDIPINSAEDVKFVRYDYLAQNEEEYEYAIVPIIGNIEGDYSINEIESKFYGIFITDGVNAYKFKENASYNSVERVRRSGVYEPYGSKYPIVVSNGSINYMQGNVSGDIIVLDDNMNIDRKATVNKLKSLEDFLTKDSAKILKDFNGNIWLVTLYDNIPLNYYSEVGMGFAQASFNWLEIGDSDNGQDLYDNNLIYANN